MVLFPFQILIMLTKSGLEKCDYKMIKICKVKDEAALPKTLIRLRCVTIAVTTPICLLVIVHVLFHPLSNVVSINSNKIEIFSW